MKAAIKNAYKKVRTKLRRRPRKNVSRTVKKTSSTTSSRKIRYRQKTPGPTKYQSNKKSTSTQRTVIKKRKRVRDPKCIRTICNLKFNIETKHDKDRLKPFYIEDSEPGNKCVSTSDINLNGCFGGNVDSLKQTFLGEGGFARVFPVKGKPNKVMRITRGWESQKENTYLLEKNGLKFIEKLNKADPTDKFNIVKIDKYGVYKTFFQGKPYFGLYSLQDKYTGGDLFDVQKLYRKEIRNYPKFMYKICCDLANAVAFIHRNNICNRDIKSENVMMVKPIKSLNDIPEIKMIDFGLAVPIEKDGLVSRANSTGAGTTNFKSPEMVMGKHYGPLTDVWSLGITFYDIYRFKTPFEDGIRHESEISSIEYGTMEEYDNDLYNLLRKMLTVSENRVTSQEVATSITNIYKKKLTQGVVPSESGKNTYV